MKKIILAVLLMSISIFGQDTYRIYDKSGKPATIEQIVAAIGQTDVFFLASGMMIQLPT